jgi:hypothetical protein
LIESSLIANCDGAEAEFAQTLCGDSCGEETARHKKLENVLEPKLMGSSLKMHPIAVLLVTVAGGVLAGIVGLIIAAPIAAIGINLWHELEASGFFGPPREEAVEVE